MEIEENIVSLDDLMENKEKLTFQYSQELKELYEIKDNLLKELEIKKKDIVCRNIKKYVKLLFNNNNVEQKLKKNRNDNSIRVSNSKSLSTKLDSDSN
jgi:uncharacterized protein YifE (UPF0438 family)